MANDVKYLPLGDIEIQGGAKLIPINPANVPTPATGQKVLLVDSTNSNKLSVKDDTGAVTEVGAGSSVAGVGWGAGTITADQMPMSFDETAWSVSTRPNSDVIDGVDMLMFDYETAEYVGVITLDELPTDTTKLKVKIKTRPYNPAATGANVGWMLRYFILRDGTAPSAIANISLGDAVAFETDADGDTTINYEVLYSALSAQVGDVINCLIYQNVGVATPKASDWALISATFGVA